MEAAARGAQKVSNRARSWIARNDRGSLPPRPPWLQGVVTRLARDLPDTPRGIVDRPADYGVPNDPRSRRWAGRLRITARSGTTAPGDAASSPCEPKYVTT